MKFRFKKGTHRARPWIWLKWFPILVDPYKLIRRVVFSNDSKYVLDQNGNPNDDGYDVNKLFGLTYSFNPKRNSARFGWRFDQETNQFIIYSFCHINGTMIFNQICAAIPGRYYDLKITINGLVYRFYVYDDNGSTIGYDETSMGHSSTLAWLLGPYFGGNAKAPANLSLEIKKI